MCLERAFSGYLAYFFKVGVSVGWSPACVASPRRGYRRVWVVPGGETRGVSGFQPPRW
jgi:hypothetical protein